VAKNNEADTLLCLPPHEHADGYSEVYFWGVWLQADCVTGEQESALKQEICMDAYNEQ